MNDAVLLQNDVKQRWKKYLKDRFPNKSKKQRLLLSFRFKRRFPESYPKA